MTLAATSRQIAAVVSTRGTWSVARWSRVFGALERIPRSRRSEGPGSRDGFEKRASGSAWSSPSSEPDRGVSALQLRSLYGTPRLQKGERKSAEALTLAGAIRSLKSFPDWARVAEKLRSQMKAGASGGKLIRTLEEVPVIKRLFQQPGGPGVAYSLGWHTVQVIDRLKLQARGLERYSGDLSTRQAAVLGAALHDIGKPLAMAEDGHSGNQHAYTRPLVEAIVGKLQAPESERRLVRGLLAPSLLGDVMQGKATPQAGAHRLWERSQIAGIPFDRFFQLAVVFYTSDACSHEVLHRFFNLSNPHALRPQSNHFGALLEAAAALNRRLEATGS